MRRLLARLRTPAGSRFITITSGKILAAVIQALFFAAFAQLLGLAPFGVFSIGYSLTLVTMSLFEFGFGSMSLRISREDSPNRSLSTILFTRVISNLFVISGLVVVWGILFSNGPLLALLVALFAIGETWGNLVQNLLIGLYRERASVLLLLLRRVVLLVAVVVALISGPAMPEQTGFFVAGVGGLFSVVLSACFVVKHLARPYSPIQFVSGRRRFWATSLADNARQLDVVIVGAIGGEALAGLYAAANRLVTPLSLLTSSIVQSLVPELIRRAESDLGNHQYVKRIGRFMTLLAVIIVLASATAPWLISVLYGAEFSAAWPIAVAAFFVAAFGAMNQCYFAWEYMRGIAAYLPYAVAASSVLYLALLLAAAFSHETWVVASAMIVSGGLSHLYYRYRFNRSGQELGRS